MPPAPPLVVAAILSELRYLNACPPAPCISFVLVLKPTIFKRDKYTMTLTRRSENDEVQFQWGKKRGIGGAKRDVQFYESFNYDGVEYFLFDGVYLHKKGESEPYIGKIVKIWEQANKKKVKILWFFHPLEIQKYLGDYTPSDKEIFLASGEGVGLANINQLEAVAGKCCVICISQDERNPQPSEEEVRRADHVFKCTFDVQSLNISATLPDKIAGIEVRCLLNPKKDETVPSISKVEANGPCDHGATITRQSSPFGESTSYKVKGKNNIIEGKEKNLQESKSLLNEKIDPIPFGDPPIKGKGKVTKDESSKHQEKKQCSNKNHPTPDDRASKKVKVDDSVKCSDDLEKIPRM